MNLRLTLGYGNLLLNNLPLVFKFAIVFSKCLTMYMYFEKTCARDNITVAINVRSFVFVKPDDGVNSETSFWINVISLTFGP